MTRIKSTVFKTGKSILLVDDKEDYRNMTAAIIEREGHEVVKASSGEEALKLLKQRYFDLLLLDYYMPGGMSGEETVNKLRKFNPYIQIILQTGYAGENPPREMLKRLDIQGFHDKSDGPENLLMWIDIGIKAAFTVQHLRKSRESLRYILNITPELHKIQDLKELLQGILLQVSGLLGVMNTFLVVFSDFNINNFKKDNIPGFIALVEESELLIKVSTGRFSSKKCIDFDNNCVDINIIQEALNNKKIMITDLKTVIPLCIGDESLGVIYLEHRVNLKQDIELLNVFANQAAVAIQNSRLYEMATFDHLTGLYVQRFFNQCLQRELRTSLRSNQALLLIMLDLDELKEIYEIYGHLVGDEVLSQVGKILKESTRSSDFACRYSNDEFIILLTNTSIDKAEIVVKRILVKLNDKLVESIKDKKMIKVSIGVVGLECPKFKNDDFPHPIPNTYFEKLSDELIKTSNNVLYDVKKDINNNVHYHKEIKWPKYNIY